MAPPHIKKIVQLPDSTWRMVNPSEGESVSYTAKIYLSETLDATDEQFLRKIGVHLPPNFFWMHSQDATVTWECPLPDSETIFFAKWATPTVQLKDEWNIEQRIVVNKPYDTDTVRDPSELRLDHTRYEREPTLPVRPYHPISCLDSGQGPISIALIECVSMYLKRSDGVTTGFILFDPRRFHRKTHKKYAFWSDGDGPNSVTRDPVFLAKQACRDRFVEKLTTATGGKSRSDSPPIIVDILLEMITEDEFAVLATVNDSLSSIELSMGNDVVLAEMVDIWRDKFGRWRNLLSRSRNLVGYMAGVQSIWDVSGSDGARTASTNRLKRLQVFVHSTSTRVDSTFQAFAATMNIVERRRAIRQTETAAKLTWLAFFFVPPTLTTGLFGANINEFKDQLTLWHWVVTSLSVSLLTYVIFYRHQVLDLVVRSAHVLADTSPNHISKMATKWLAIARATWRAAPDLLIFGLWLGLNAVIIMSLWQVIESSIALEVKQAISLVFLSGYAVAATVPLVLRYRQRPGKSSAARLLGAILAVALMLTGMGVGLWKILGSQLAPSAKTAAASGIMCSSAMMSLAFRLVASRQSMNRSSDVAGDWGSI